MDLDPDHRALDDRLAELRLRARGRELEDRQRTNEMMADHPDELHRMIFQAPDLPGRDPCECGVAEEPHMSAREMEEFDLGVMDPDPILDLRPVGVDAGGDGDLDIVDDVDLDFGLD